ncbi:ORF 2 [Malva mosaic virus]|uniref:ORF 2 n=1 Tax=Malva mosaic virus TaxID=392174 RepID=Q0Z8V4_9VIRU|nr:ORF 2 [Malva mosaic virus]ABG48661.1 ORF 2 [Malva mosaic virus]
MELDYLIKLLEFNNFPRTNLDFSLPLVVHGVAGCGKSTIISKLAKAFPTLVVASFTPQILDGNTGRKQVAVDGSPVDILDEYLSGPTPSVRLALFCDPLQYSCEKPRLPHFISLTTHRFCPLTADFLNSKFGCEIISLRQDSCEIVEADPFATDPEGVVITFEPEVKSILERHQCFPTDISTLWGKNLETVSVYLSSFDTCLDSFRTDLFLSLTRHTKKLLVFDFNAWPDSSDEL